MRKILILFLLLFTVQTVVFGQSTSYTTSDGLLLFQLPDGFVTMETPDGVIFIGTSEDQFEFTFGTGNGSLALINYADSPGFQAFYGAIDPSITDPTSLADVVGNRFGLTGMPRELVTLGEQEVMRVQIDPLNHYYFGFDPSGQPLITLISHGSPGAQTQYDDLMLNTLLASALGGLQSAVTPIPTESGVLGPAQPGAQVPTVTPPNVVQPTQAAVGVPTIASPTPIQPTAVPLPSTGADLSNPRPIVTGETFYENAFGDVPNIAEPADCSGFALARYQTDQINEIGLRNIPIDTFDMATDVYLQSIDGARVDVLLIEYDDNSRIVNIPLHPSDPFAGGDVTLYIKDATGSDLCPPQTIILNPLPDAPGALQAFVDAHGAYLAAERAASDVTVDFLRPEHPDPLPDALLPLTVAQYLYDDPSYPNSLVRIADGTAPMATNMDPRLTDAIIAQSGLIDMAQLHTTLLQDKTASRPRTVRLMSRNNVPPGQENIFLPWDTREVSKIVDKVEINGYEDLVTWMNSRVDASGPTSANTTPGKIWNNLGLTIAIGGRVIGDPGVMGAVYFNANTIYQARANLLPQKITSFTFDVDSPISHEDDVTTHNYDNLRVTAESGVWDMTLYLADAAVNIAGAKGTTTKISGNAAEMGLNRVISGRAISVDTAIKVLNAADKAGDGAQFGMEVGLNLAGRNDKAANQQVVTLGPYTWTNIPIDPEHVRATVVGPPTQAIRITNPQAGTYTALNATTSQLRLLLPLPGISPPIAYETVSVTPGLVTINAQGPTTVQAGEDVCLTGDIQNMLDRRVEWTITGANFSDTFVWEAPTEYCFTAPEPTNVEWTPYESCDAEPQIRPNIYSVTLKSLSDDGPRDQSLNPSWQERYDVMAISVNYDDLVDTLEPPPRPDECDNEETVSGPAIELRPGRYQIVNYDSCTGSVDGQLTVYAESWQDFNGAAPYYSVILFSQPAPGTVRMYLDPGIVHDFVIIDDESINAVLYTSANQDLSMMPQCTSITNQDITYLGPN
jgi:hypothetical protein